MNRLLLLPSFFFLLLGCASASNQPSASEQNSPFTHGNVQLSLKKDLTTQADVLNTFGAPNVATHDSEGNEVWTYQKNATIAKATESSAYGTIILFGGGSSTTGFERSSRSMTLILKFNTKKVLIDFSSMTTSF